MALKEKVLKGMLVLAACLCLGMPATVQSAVSLTVDGGWYDFSSTGGGTWYEEFSFTLPTPGILTVTDSWSAGARYEVFSNGVSLGLTSVPTGSVYDVTSDHDLASNDPRWSTGRWNLAPGNYLISGKNVASLVGYGDLGVLRVDTAAAPPAPVPVPAAAWLLGAALAGCLGLRRFQRRDA